jgi:general stress protein YciG
MDPNKQREIASKGGKAAHQKGTAHEFTTEEARAAGRKGGAASRAKRSAQGEPQGGPPPGMGREPGGEELNNGEPQGENP